MFSAAVESGCVELNVNTGKQGETAGPVLSDVRGIQLYQHLQSSVINTLHLVCLISQQTRTKKPQQYAYPFYNLFVCLPCAAESLVMRLSVSGYRLHTAGR